MFFLPLPFILIELLVATTAVHFYGFWDTFLMYVGPSLLGVLMLSVLGRTMISSLQAGLVQGQLPGDRVLHRGAIIFGSFLLVIPTFSTRVMALILILPIFRHISIFIFKRFVFKKMAKMPFTFVRTGPFGFGGAQQQGPFSQEPFTTTKAYPRERDAEVVDVTPLEITHTKKDS